MAAVEAGEHEPPRSVSSKTHWGIFVRRERWSLSYRGWLVAGAIFLFAVCSLFLNAHSFLAVTHRVETKVLVVEGWINRHAIGVGATEFKAGSYDRVFTTGGPENYSGGYVNDYQTSASVGADLLVNVGLPTEVVQMVPSHVIGPDRTYSSAVALRNWFHEHNVPVQSFNVVTEDAHARRTRLLFQKAFGNSVQVGVISVRNPDYNPKRWWRSSEGVRETIGESLAYLYARILFHPGE